VRCVSSGAERRGGVLCVAPAYVVSPQEGKKNKKARSLPRCKVAVPHWPRALDTNALSGPWLFFFGAGP
jgi:hypothetical protein